MFFCSDCYSFWCCCCNKACAVLEDDDDHLAYRDFNDLKRLRPILSSDDLGLEQEEDEGATTSSFSIKRKSSSSSNITASSSGSSMYIKSVYSAFQLHFQDDPELRPIWNSLSHIDILTTVYRMTKYRERRMKRGLVEPPTPIPAVQDSPRLTASDVKDWLFFAEVAYEEQERKLRKQLMEERNHQLISHENRVGLFEPAHYLSMSLNPNERVVVIGVKGTSSMDDWLTNLWIAKEELNVLKKPSTSEDNINVDFAAHSGVVHAARFVLTRVGMILDRAFYQAGFSVIVVGHSLGAGVATVLAMLLREEMNMERVKCFAFAPPPAVSRYLAERARSYIYSIVNNDDAIPRTSVKQLKTLLAGIRKLLDERERFGGWDPLEAELDKLEWSQVESIFAQGWKETRYETFVAGRILFLYDFGETARGQVEVPCDSHNLRISIISSRMVADHGVESYRAALDFGSVV